MSQPTALADANTPSHEFRVLTIYEGVPDYPDGWRPWRIAEKLGVKIFLHSNVIA